MPKLFLDISLHTDESKMKRNDKIKFTCQVGQNFSKNQMKNGQKNPSSSRTRFEIQI